MERRKRMSPGKEKYERNSDAQWKSDGKKSKINNRKGYRKINGHCGVILVRYSLIQINSNDIPIKFCITN